MAGVKGRSGRKKNPSTLIKEARNKIELNYPKIIDKLLELGFAGDREALLALKYDITGKPKVQIDQRIAGFIITGDEYELACRLAEADEKLLEGGKDALQRPTEAEGILEGEKEATEDVHPD